MNVYLRVVAGIGLVLLMACNGVTATHHDRHPVDPVVDMLHRGILDLEGNVDELNERITELQQLPPVSDPTIQELRALDLAGWQLHQQQWLVQRERLFLAVSQIQQAQLHPSQQSNLWAQWKARQQQFITAMEDLRSQRHALERKRLAVESQLLERYFQKTE